MCSLYDFPVNERKAAFIKSLNNAPYKDNERVERTLKILEEFRSGFDEDEFKDKYINRYICIKGFHIPYFDENMSMTDRYGEVVKDSIWEVSEDISESDIRLDKVGGFSDFDFIDITNEDFNTSFITLE